MNTGVYCIRNRRSGKRYVGSATKSIKRRWVIHRYSLKRGNHHSRHLQAAWNKYGEKAFKFEVLEYCFPRKCLAKEQKWLDRYESYKGTRGYNISPTAGNSLGVKFTDETKSKIAAALTGKARPAWHMEGARLALLGKKLPKVHKSKISKGLQRHYQTHDGPNLGRKLSKEWCENIAKANLGRKFGPCPEERKKKIAESLRGRKLSEETRRKMSEAHKRRLSKGGQSGRSISAEKDERAGHRPLRR